LFGLGIGALVLLFTLFGFFNEVVIAPFIRPGGTAEATPIILNTDGVAPNSTPEVIVPKINVQLPIVYGNSTTESEIQKSLEEGIIHYPTTAKPGQQGNAAFFGHSSNNIFNKGKYKFAFVLLHELVPGDIFYLTYEGKVYSYKVFDKAVVEPTDTWVLNPVAGKAATVALITCDPPGTSLRRLVVWGEQITPDPNGNSAAPTAPATAPLEELPSNSPSLWSRFWGWITPG
jgi:sortase A